jgi:hypothetical protein
MFREVMSEKLEQRIRRLEALESIRTCIYSYAAAGDRKNDPTVISRLFAEDASYTVPGMLNLVGLNSIIEGLTEAARSKVLWSFHHPGGPIIELSDDATSARAFWWVWIPVKFASDAGPRPHWTAGHYNADLVAIDNEWKFQQLLFEAKLLMPIEGPWTTLDGDFQWLV